MFDSEFFPTPPHIVYKMLAKVSKDAQHFLEPSAGKGDIADIIKSTRPRATIDCIERSPELVSVLLGKNYPVVGYDWLDYAGVSFYDCLLMNPPFSNGDEHLLKAWDFLHHGEIVCLLNEETIKNRCTKTRERLGVITSLHGEIEFLDDCFASAERKTGVRVAMVYLKKVSDDDSVDLWSTGKEEKAYSEDIGGEEYMLAIRDSLGNMQHHYDNATEHMLKAFQHIRKAAIYMGANGLGIGIGGEYGKILALAADNTNNARAEFVRKHRRDCWNEVLGRTEFRKWLDKKQTAEFVRDIERNGNIPFTKENIKGTLENIFLSRKMLFEKSVANVFDELTRYYKGNTNHVEGWKSNDSYKVNQKLVFPWGCVYDRYFHHSYSTNSVVDIYNDLDRVLCVMDSKKFEECQTIGKALDIRFKDLGWDPVAPFDNTAESEFFHIKFFKKGTVHLVFKDKKLWQQFNVTASKGKNWIGQET